MGEDGLAGVGRGVHFATVSIAQLVSSSGICYRVPLQFHPCRVFGEKLFNVIFYVDQRVKVFAIKRIL